ncbi:serine/threonine protein kinase [Allokutzneria sp. A3M-2-11 16]|uniref:serine/threonine-protein kinase n=1 Tax=Allokutzneria sp. A3M-2-11 16 TaxID=2962043 RepID=UPI0020B7A1E3|nr:serine/threonine-protein kinase [Allokutzneria sp. A3M-2-11 16]MCP3798798.1 serine/threonine protein kinase [Allokutzneria sp. A3M-2-11 16]
MSDEGRLVAGRYRLERRIGAGAMGVVWQARDERLHRVVAVKQLLLQSGMEAGEAEEAKQRAMREGRIAARLQHPNAIGVFDVAEDNGLPCLVMEYLPSRSLANVVYDEGKLPPREVARIGSHVAIALAAAHAAGIVHRDIKPGNILLGDDGSVKITDFGISRATGDVTVTKTGMLAGTPAYLAPEVAKGYEPGPASDVFSLGSTLYAAVEGEPPFGLNENTLALLHLVAAGIVRPPQLAGPLTSVLMHLLRPQPTDRPTMTQASEALRAIAEGRAAPMVTPPQGWGAVPPTTQIPGGPSAPTQAVHPGLRSGPNLNPRTPVPGNPGSNPNNPAMTRLDARPLSDAPATRVGPGATSIGGANGAAGRTGGSPPGGGRDRDRREEPEERRSNTRPILIAVAAVVAAALLGILLSNWFGGPDRANSGTQATSDVPSASSAPPKKSSSAKSTTTTTETTTTTAPTTTTSAATEKDYVNAVKNYYKLLPGNTEVAFSKFCDSYRRGQNYTSYKKYWDSVSRVKVSDAEMTSDKVVSFEIETTYKSTETPINENKQLKMGYENGQACLAST